MLQFIINTVYRLLVGAIVLIGAVVFLFVVLALPMAGVQYILGADLLNRIAGYVAVFSAPFFVYCTGWMVLDLREEDKAYKKRLYGSD